MLVAIAGGILLLVGVPAAALILAIGHFAHRHRRQVVWPLYAAGVVICSIGYVILGQVVASGSGVEPLDKRLIASVVASAILLLPIPLLLDDVGQPGVRLRRSGLMALGAVLGLSLVFSPVLAIGLGCWLMGVCF
jgi:hypothetical protein